MDIQGIPDDELDAEVERRKKAKIEAPFPVAKPDFSNLRKTVIDCVTDAVKEDYWDDDAKHYIYEAAMEAVYGPGYWAWRKQKNW